jgi:hypothetical protein
MNKKAEEAAQHDGGVVKVDATGEDEDLGDTIKENVGAMPSAPAAPTIK